jgi:DNA-binding MarR family transcriptional regulator
VGDVLKQRIKQTKFEGPAQEALLNLLVASGHLRALVDAVCEQRGITQAQFNVLRILRGAHPEGYPRGEISARMVDRAPDVTRLIDRLESAGLVERVKGTSDRRLSVTRITRAGLSLLTKLDGPIREINAGLARRVAASDLRHLSRICERVYGPDDQR